jgi:GH18 family chitinase
MKDAKYHGIKNILQVGSWDTINMSPIALSELAAADPEKIQIFANNLLDILNSFNFDGVYIFWVFPGCPVVCR